MVKGAVVVPKLNWSFPCSPRNPSKIVPELKLLNRYTNVWRQRNIKWGPSFDSQEEYGMALREMEESEHSFQLQTDELTTDNLCWTARARFATYKYFGFVYIDDAGFCELTDAGKRLITTLRPSEVMLRQLLKWQYPDPQHKGASYPENVFSIFPFPAVSSLIRSLEGLTKVEMSLFIFTMTKMSQIEETKEEIREFRSKYRSTRGRVNKKELIETYKDYIKRKHERTGGSVAINSFYDYADALIRYFRYTAMFSVRGDRLIVAADQASHLDEILSLDYKFYPYDDSIAFYQYYGDPDIPVLPYEGVKPLKEDIRALQQEIKDLVKRKNKLLVDTQLQTPIPDIVYEQPPNTINEAKEMVFCLRDIKYENEYSLFEIEAQNPDFLNETVDYYTLIIEREVVDPPTYFEWNTWRTFVSIDRGNIIPNFSLDIELQPLNHAPGGKADIEIYFDPFILVVEVTLKKGAVQWRDESMPVPRHVLDVQNSHPEKKVYGLFIAPKIHCDTKEQFYICMHHAVIGGSKVTVIPLTLDQYLSFLSPYTQRLRQFDPSDLQILLDEIIAIGDSVSDGQEWCKQFDDVIAEWKNNLLD